LKFVCGAVTRLTASLDVPLGAAGSALGARSLGELIPGEDDIEEKMVEEMQRTELDAVLRARLKPMERAAVRLRFGLEDGHARTLVEVGELLSISKERVRQHVFSALAKLKTPEVRERLEDYLS
jgi:RNA polymerase primary sigma factor